MAATLAKKKKGGPVEVTPEETASLDESSRQSSGARLKRFFYSRRFTLSWFFTALSRYVHTIVQWVIFMPVFPRSVRPVLLRLIGFKIGKDCRIGHAGIFQSRNIVIGDQVTCNIGAFFEGYGGLELEDGVSIGPFVRITTSSHTVMPSVYRRDKREQTMQPVKVGRGAWIGIGAIIMPGVTIGEGCVIGAGAVVTRSTEPNGLYVGSPAERIKTLPVETERRFSAGKLV